MRDVKIRHNTEDEFLEEMRKHAGRADVRAGEERDRQLAELVGDVYHLLSAVKELKDDLGMSDRMHRNCPVCGWREVDMNYCNGCMLRPYPSSRAPGIDVCHDGDPEHFHRRCERCNHRWRTNDIADAQIRCADALRRLEAQA